MVSQKKHKGTIAIKLKLCQYLDTSRDIILFNVSFCSTLGLGDLIRGAVIKQKNTMVTHYPLNTHQLSGVDTFRTWSWSATL
jgi:hypothetical protein